MVYFEKEAGSSITTAVSFLCIALFSEFWKMCELLVESSWWSWMLGCSGVNGRSMNDQECSWCYQSMNHFVWQWNSSQRGSFLSLKMFSVVVLLFVVQYFDVPRSNVIISGLILRWEQPWITHLFHHWVSEG